MDTLCAQLLLQFYADSFQTLQVFLFHGLKICMWFGYSPQIIFCHFFLKLNLVIFSAFSLSKWIDSKISCVHNSSYSFMPSSFGNLTGDCVMVWRYACGLGYSPQIFCLRHLFLQVKLSHFSAFLLSKWIDSGYLVCATPPTVLCQILFKPTGLLVMVWRYECRLDIVPQIILSLFPQVELSHFFRHFYYQSE